MIRALLPTRGSDMRRLPTTLFAFAAATAFAAPAFAHHSQAMFDTSQELVIKGTVARFDWVNPHMYLIVNTTGPDGKPAQVEGEGLGITQALVDGLRKEDLQPGTPVVMRANPNRGGWGKQVRILDVTTEDGEIHPFYEANKRTRTLTPGGARRGVRRHGALAGHAGRACHPGEANRGRALLRRARTVHRGARRAAHDRDRQRRDRDELR
jgi:hypothetical protein